MKRAAHSTLIIVVALLVAHPVFAGEEGNAETPWEKLSLTLGGFYTALDSKVRIGSDQLGAGVEVDAEDALALDSTTSVFRSEALYRAGKSMQHNLELSYLDMRRNSTKELERDVEFRDKTYAVGTRVESFINVKVIRAGYNYSFFQDDRINMALGLGFYVMPIELGVDASGIGKEEESVTAPLPTLSLVGEYAFSSKLIMKQRVDLFWLEYENFKGAMTNVRVALEYNAFKHLGLGLGLDSFRLRLRAEGEDYPEIDFVGDIEFSYIGAMLYAKLYY